MSLNEKKLAALEERIGHPFADRDLLINALTHSSFGDGRRKRVDNERLEFLGDRVLGLLTAERLYRDSEGQEGLMARRLNALVRKETCADIARAVDLGDMMRLSAAEDKQGGRDKISILGDACEALLGAIYLDGGREAAEQFYTRFWAGHIEHVLGGSGKDPKTALQEKAARGGNPNTPVYTLVERSGPDHCPTFVIEVSIKGRGTARGEGASKKEAERKAAAVLLEEWNGS